MHGQGAGKKNIFLGGEGLISINRGQVGYVARGEKIIYFLIAMMHLITIPY